VLHADYLIDEWIVAHRSGVFSPVMLALSAFGVAGLGWFIVGTILTVARRLPARGLGALLIAIICASLIVNRVMKPMAGRPRPFERTPALQVLGPRPTDTSFPSGHAATSGAAAMVLSVFVPEARAVWWLVASGIAYSRVYLGDHFPLDVIGGGATGALVGWAVARGLSRIGRPS
jgi:undecaprenyl-diphosphatase